jgi:hypothetical protein
VFFLEPVVIKSIGFSALGLLVLGWLAVSFMAEGKTRSVLEWLSATCMYVAVLALFLNLFNHAQENGRTLLMIIFAILSALFASGAVVSAVKTVGCMTGAIRD